MAQLDKQTYKSSWNPNVAEMVISYDDNSAAGAAGVYSISTVIPAGAYILDVQVHTDTLWDNGTSATLIVGDSDDPNGFYDAVNAKATDLVANEVLSFYHLGGKEGAYVTDNNGVMTQYASTARTISAQMTTVGTTATAGVTRIIVIWAKPTDSVKSDFTAS